MNQDQVKELLLKIVEVKEPFTVVFTGKSSKKLNGLYKPESAEILIHNKNFETDSAMLYTAIHEYAHHIQFVKTGKAPHDKVFWATFHHLLDVATEKGLYKPIAPAMDLADALARVKEKLEKHAALEAEIGKELALISSLCEEHRVRFDELVDRDLKIKRTTVKRFQDAAVNYQLFETLDDVTVVVNADMVAAVARARVTREEDDRPLAAETLAAGSSLFAPTIPVDPLTPEEDAAKQYAKLEKKKKVIVTTIGKLEVDVAKIEEKMQEIQAELSFDAEPVR